MGIKELDKDDCFTKVTSYGLAYIEKIEFVSKKGVTGTIGYSDNNKELPESFDFKGGCLVGVYGHTQNNIIR